MQFTELNLHPDLQRGIDDLGFTTCTDVQASTFEHTLHGRDVTVQSQTGSGKTAAFLISIYQLMNTDERFKGARALMVAPTRELAVQIENDAKALGKYLPQRTGCFYGGVGYAKQEKDLADRVELVIGTPGRLLDFSQSGKLDLRDMAIVVIDEADRLFDMGFYPDIRKMMRRTRPRTERITMLYSATLSVSVRNISYQFMNEPAEIEIKPEHLTVDTVEQELFHVAKDEKFSLLLGVLRKEEPKNAIIFCNTKRATEIVAKKLRHNGYQCEFIIGDLPQKKRLSIIDRLKNGEVNMLTATDVAARGLHVDDLDLVVNYDIPEDPEAYVHRIGRTARAGKEGKAVSLACERFVFGLPAIEELIGIKIPTSPVTDELLSSDESEGKSLGLSHRDDRPPRRRTDDRRPRTRSSSPHHREKSHSDGHPKRSGSSHPGHAGEARPHRGGSRTGRPSRPRQPEQQGADRGPSRDASMEDRLAYYEKKYGEGFGAKGGTGKAGPGKLKAAKGHGGKSQSDSRQREDADGRNSRGETGNKAAKPRNKQQTPVPKRATAASSGGGKDTPAPAKRKKGLFGRLRDRLRGNQDVDN